MLSAMRSRYAAFILGLALPFLIDSSALAQTSTASAGDVVLLMPEPPDDYIVTKNRLSENGKEVAILVTLVKEGSPNKIVISVETSRDLSTKPVRIAATKGYINGTIESLQGAGLKVTESKLPDVEKATFAGPLGSQLTIQRPDNSPAYMRQIIFFTDKGYHIQIIALDKNELQALSNWALRIKPAGKSEPAGNR